MIAEWVGDYNKGEGIEMALDDVPNWRRGCRTDQPPIAGGSLR